MAMPDISWSFERTRNAAADHDSHDSHDRHDADFTTSELAELLSLPPGLHGQSIALDAVPRTAADARVLHTHLARALGRTYRERWGLLLRVDRLSIQLMQRILHARFPTASVRSAGDAAEVFRHAAFYSEILARRCGAAWSNLEYAEVAQWRMKTASGRDVDPFARVLGFILGDGGPDLVRVFDDLVG